MSDGGVVPVGKGVVLPDLHCTVLVAWPVQMALVHTVQVRMVAGVLVEQKVGFVVHRDTWGGAQVKDLRQKEAFSGRHVLLCS